MENIFKIKQGSMELLREFMDRFHRERMMLPRVPDNWAAMAFASNLNERSSEDIRRLKESLREFPATTWNDVYNRYNTKLRIEEDIVSQLKVEKRSKPEQARFDQRSRKKEAGDKVRWPKEMRSDPSKKSQEFWCEFHNDHGHRATDCRLLQAEVAYLLKKGHLIDLFSEKGKKSYMKNMQKPPKPSPPKRTVNWIRQVSEGDIITFDDEDANGFFIPHNDVLVISLLVHDTNVKRVLIDPGSFVNIIFLRVVNEMQAIDHVIPKARSLSGFDNSSVITKGEITLSTFAECVMKDTKFQVVDADIADNIILGRPWIHDMDAVPSTLHQI
ncbi:uncharacterized protein [Nicotiana sylvestris]|uniref:uncharacterized protein n=1 Tax=Nicotiana sylvestris TaxID=4096 RepID=UPI00388C95D7